MTIIVLFIFGGLYSYLLNGFLGLLLFILLFSAVVLLLTISLLIFKIVKIRILANKLNKLAKTQERTIKEEGGTPKGSLRIVKSNKRH